MSVAMAQGSWHSRSRDDKDTKRQALPLGDDSCLRRPPAHESISRRSKTQTQRTTEEPPWMSA
jgi:hypothetical protein